MNLSFVRKVVTVPRITHLPLYRVFTIIQPDTNHVSSVYKVAAILCLQSVLQVMQFLMINVLYFYISTFRSLCSVPKMAVFGLFLVYLFPFILVRYLLNDFRRLQLLLYYYYYYYYYFISETSLSNNNTKLVKYEISFARYPCFFFRDLQQNILYVMYRYAVSMCGLSH
jgi:hypothetical protein